MSYRRTGRGAGFTLVELLVVFAVIGIIATMLVPLFLDAMNKAKQRRTMAEIHTLGQATMSWVTDMSSAAAAGQGATTISMADFEGPVTRPELEMRLVTQYIQELPLEDGWRFPVEVYLETDIRDSANLVAIRSPARNGVFEGDTYTVGPFETDWYEQDIVWADGFFVRWPERLEP